MKHGSAIEMLAKGDAAAILQRLLEEIEQQRAFGQLARTLDQLEDEGPISKTSIYEAIRDGRLIARKCGRRTLVLREDWLAFLQSLPKIRPKDVARDAT
jgi:hypothetical protein